MALLLLRILQSLGASAIVAIGYGVVADIATSAERGALLGPAMIGELDSLPSVLVSIVAICNVELWLDACILTYFIAANFGPIIGPIIGGPLAGKVGWRWMFRLLTILGCVFLLCILMFLPETCRTIVGNGEILPPP